MGHHFVSVDRSTPFLLPPSLQEWLPQEHLARFVVEVVEQLDLSPLESSYAGRGSKAYHPGMLLAMLFYGYATGVSQAENWKRLAMIQSPFVISAPMSIPTTTR